MIVPLEELENTGGTLCHGCFDLMHIGHIRYLKWARSLNPNSLLIVTLTADDFFPKYKRFKPAFPQDIRAESLDALYVVDFVALVHEPTALLAIHTIKPEIYAKGWEAQGVIPLEVAATEEHGGRVEYMQKEGLHGQLYSSGSILSGEYLKTRCH